MKVMRIFERLEKVRRPTQRCKSRVVGLESHDSSYVTMGQHANRGGPGVLNSKMNLLKSREKQLVVCFVRQIEEVFRRWVDWSVVFGFSVTRQVQGFPVFRAKTKSRPSFHPSHLEGMCSLERIPMKTWLWWPWQWIWRKLEILCLSEVVAADTTRLSWQVDVEHFKMEDFLMPDICHSLVEQSVIKDNVFANRLSGMFSPW